MERKQLDADAVFKSYIVKDTPENWVNYAGIIANVEFSPSKDRNDDYDCIVTAEVKLKNEHCCGHQFYRNIFTQGRCEFQSFVKNFEIIEEDEDGTVFLNVQKLLGMYCKVAVNTAGKVKSIRNIDLRSNEKYKEIADFLDENVQIAEQVDVDSIPEEIIYYRIIPMSCPYDEWKVKKKYHACIMDLACYASDDGTNDVDVKVSAYVFNGGTTKVMARYFNRIHSRGKEEFDDFCCDFDLIGKKGSVNTKKIIGTVCAVTLFQNKKGNFYIDTLQPLDDVDDIASYHYDLLIQEAESCF